jgi:hypothetical protein
VKTTVELPDNILREVKATAARRGIALRQYFLDALSEKLAREGTASVAGGPKDWPVPPPDVPLEELRKIHAYIEEEFEQIEPLDDDE